MMNVDSSRKVKTAGTNFSFNDASATRAHQDNLSRTTRNHVEKSLAGFVGHRAIGRRKRRKTLSFSFLISFSSSSSLPVLAPSP